MRPQRQPLGALASRRRILSMPPPSRVGLEGTDTSRNSNPLSLQVSKMKTLLSFEPSPDFVDPRLRLGFERACWPLCNGKAAPPPHSPDLHERRCLEFLAAFYQLNVLNKRLLASRKAAAPKKRIKSLLDKIASATSALEALEDRYAPIGFFGEPVMKGIRYHNVVFVRPQLSRLQPKASTLSSYIAIPGLDKIPASELRGPVKIFRFGHGKMDL